MNALNWVGNVLLPLLAAYNVARGVVQTQMKHFNSLQDRFHYFIVAFACLSVSAILRLAEHFVATAKAVSYLQFYIHSLRRYPLMSLHVSTVSRNLNAQIMLFGLEFEDLMVITVLGVAAMLIGQFLFSDRYLFFLPMNWALLLIVVLPVFLRSCC